MKTTDKNLVYFCYSDKLCPEILECLNEISPRFNLEIEQHNISQPCEPKTQSYNKKFVIFYGCKQDDLKLLQEDYEKYKELLKNITIILCCPFLCDSYKEKVNAQYCINCSDISNFKKNICSIFETSLQQIFSTSKIVPSSDDNSQKRYIK
jgi:hypothetical protein